MKATLIRTAAALAAALVCYLTASFALWDLNPANWSFAGRTCVAFMVIIFGIWAAAFPFEIKP